MANNLGITFTVSQTAYKKAKAKVTRANRLRRGRRSIPSDSAAAKAATNRDRAVVEVYEFKNRKQAKSFAGYLKNCDPGKVSARGCIVTNWTGLRLCSASHTGKRGIKARCIDGRTYVGRSNGDGMWISLRPAKSKR